MDELSRIEMARPRQNEYFRRRRKMNKKLARTLLALLLIIVFFILLPFAFATPTSPSSLPNSPVSALFILGDSSVNCGDNDFFNNLFHDRSAFNPCVGLETRLLPDFLGDKLGLPTIPPVYLQNGSIEGLLSGLNFGSSQATIINTGFLRLQAINHQLRQLFETVQIMQLQLGERKATELIQSSLFLISLGKDDYIHLFLRDFSGLKRRYGGAGFAHILVKQMTQVVKDLYNVNARRIVCMGIGPLGCTPRALWESYNSSAPAKLDGDNCVQEINEFVLQYNAMLSEQLLDLNDELFDAQIIFCDVYQGMIEIINHPRRYGFSDVRRACCGLGRYGGMVECVSKKMACSNLSSHVWWDFYNPTQGVNSLLANWTWSGLPFHLCHPMDIKQLVSSSVAERTSRFDDQLLLG